MSRKEDVRVHTYLMFSSSGRNTDRGFGTPCLGVCNNSLGDY